MHKKYDPYQDMLGGKISTRDIDELKRAFEDLRDQQFTREYATPIFTIEELREARKQALGRIEKLQQEIAEYDKIEQFASELPFKEGDAAFHKDHGNVLIHGVSINENFENSTYSIVLRTGKRLQVKTDELMPISEATKVLFGKK
jgi:hypothetical protein